jgi:2-desacetyl-2-hydroxyethyl bacteriochlorophyllide A dehydrogenase
MPEISIIIRAYNEEKHLPALLDALRAQTYKNFEIVVVDSGSIDRTRDIAHQKADKLVRIAPEDFTFGYSLNTGIRNSSGRFSVIMSAHTLPVNDCWLASMVEPLHQPRTAMVYGKQRGISKSKFSELRDFERIFTDEKRVLVPPDFFANNANSALRRDLWEQHAFDETLPGLEDIEWAKHWMELGYRVIYVPEGALYHIHRETWNQLRHRYYREGQAARWIGIRHRQNLPVEFWKETKSLCGDFYRALLQGCLSGKMYEIARFRFEKLRGTVSGIWNGTMMENPMTRKKFVFDKTYKAVVIHKPGHASLDEIDLPHLKPGEALVRVAYQAVCATDIEVLEGVLGYYKNGMAKYPIVPGHEFSGTVAAVGARVTDLQEGDPIVVECIQGCGECTACRRDNPIGCVNRKEVGVIGRDGGYAEYMVTPAQFVHQLPETLSLQQACLCEPIAVVVKGLRRLERAWGPGDDSRACAVVGCGPIGHMAAKVLDLRGHRVTVFDRNDRRLKCFQGSDIRVAQALDDLGAFDAIVEATGDPQALDEILHRSAAGSTLLLLGLPYSRREFSFEAIVGYDKTVVGSVGSNRRDFDEAFTVLPKIDTQAFMQSIFPLAEFERALQVSRSSQFLKVILQVDAQSI